MRLRSPPCGLPVAGLARDRPVFRTPYLQIFDGDDGAVEELLLPLRGADAETVADRDLQRLRHPPVQVAAHLDHGAFGVGRPGEHAGRDPEIRIGRNGDKVASFNLATTRRWKDKDGEPAEATEWHRIAVFGGAVRVVEEMVRKGAPLLVEGRIARREYQDKEGRQHVTEIVVAGSQGMVNLLAPKPKAGADETSGPSAGDLSPGGGDA